MTASGFAIGPILESHCQSVGAGFAFIIIESVVLELLETDIGREP
ncbi:hypothetical protein SAMN04488694_11928 [Natrinema hispanicum]|uniref:Uncharacterized protein n=1 Tax=Natrinema hispanicum TaxID=392421 RepID=A0A1I0ID02_9EURY|nr:hypothetical protein SAMN04488694_11928 [Natrinema hispanicum]